MSPQIIALITFFFSAFVFQLFKDLSELFFKGQQNQLSIS